MLPFLQRNGSVAASQEGVLHLHAVAVLRIGEEHANVLRQGLDSVRLHQVCVGAMGLRYRPWDFALLPGEHKIGNVVGIIPLELLLPLLAISRAWRFRLRRVLSVNLQLLISIH